MPVLNRNAVSLSEIEQLIRHADIAKARESITAVSVSGLNATEKVCYAGLCRRLGMPTQSLRVLRRMLWSPHRGDDLSDAWAEYSASLSAIGSQREALDILKKVNREKSPQADIFEAFLHISDWNYDDVPQLIERYLSRVYPRSYEWFVANINLSAAEIYLDHLKLAEGRLRSLIDVDSSSRLLRASTHSLLAQIHVLREESDSAERELGIAAGILADEKRPEFWVIRKWNALNGVVKSRRSAESLSGLKRLRAQAFQSGQVEIARDLDLFHAKYTQDREGFLFLYFGTPFAGFRKKLFQLIDEPLEIPEFYEWIPPRRGRVCQTLDLTKPEPQSKARHQMCWKMIALLSTDFYRPSRLGAIYAGLYEGQSFFLPTAQARVHNALGVTREFLAESKIALKIVEWEGAYRLDGNGSCAIRLSRDKTVREKGKQSHSQKLRTFFPEHYFDASQARKVLSLSSASTGRALKACVETGALERSGMGTSTLYRFKKSGS